LNVEKEEALRRYEEANKDGFVNGEPAFRFNVEKIEFEDEFETYQIYNTNIIDELG